MAKLSTLSASKTKRMLVYGPPKSGKTELVGKLAEKKRVWLVDGESGADTLFKLPAEWQDRIELIRLPDNRDYPIFIETALKIIKGGPVDICTLHGKVNCPKCMDLKEKKWKDGCEGTRIDVNTFTGEDVIVFDSLTQLTNSAIANITRNKPDDYKLTYDDWGNLGKVLDTFLSYVQNASYNVVCISHENAVEMQDGKEKLVPTAGTRNFSRNSAKYFGEVIYCEVVNKAHKFASSTTYKNNVLTGSRAGKSMEDSKDAKLLDLFD